MKLKWENIHLLYLKYPSEETKGDQFLDSNKQLILIFVCI